MTEAELDAACLAMLPLARAFTDAVRARDQDAVRAAYAAVQQTEPVMGRSPISILALVLADELNLAEAIGHQPAVRIERERCRRLVLAAIAGSGPEVLDRVKRLPRRIATGEQP